VVVGEIDLEKQTGKERGENTVGSPVQTCCAILPGMAFKNSAPLFVDHSLDQIALIGWFIRH
jgi:hypothetical protein